jgi:hypothetical protein
LEKLKGEKKKRDTHFPCLGRRFCIAKIAECDEGLVSLTCVVRGICWQVPRRTDFKLTRLCPGTKAPEGTVYVRTPSDECISSTHFWRPGSEGQRRCVKLGTVMSLTLLLGNTMAWLHTSPCTSHLTSFVTSPRAKTVN